MLCTRIILMGMDGFPGGITGEPNAEMICAANHAIPLFWVLPFAESELESYLVDSSQDNILSHEPGSAYPLLMADCSNLVDRAERLYSSLAPHLTPQDKALLQRWIVFLSELNYPVVAVDTYELWSNLEDPDALKDEIISLITLFNEMLTSDPKKALEKLYSDGRWVQNNNIALAGFGW